MLDVNIVDVMTRLRLHTATTPWPAMNQSFADDIRSLCHAYESLHTKFETLQQNVSQLVDDRDAARIEMQKHLDAAREGKVYGVMSDGDTLAELREKIRQGLRECKTSEAFGVPYRLNADLSNAEIEVTSTGKPLKSDE